MTAYATVGSTRFDDLVTAVLSTECLHALVSLGIYRLSVQRGSSPVPMASGAPVELEVDVQDYVNDVDERISAADLVISHAGSGSVLAALRGPALRPKDKPSRLFIVANPTLLDDHQSDLANAFEREGWAIKATPATLARVLASAAATTRSAASSLPPRNVTALHEALSS